MIVSLIRIDRTAESPIYLQIAHTIVLAINRGLVKPGMKMPGTRTLALALKVHRKTVENAYDELFAEGWIDRFPKKGTYVKQAFPALQLKQFNREGIPATPGVTGFEVNCGEQNDALAPFYHQRFKTEINEGLPDLRLAPTKPLTNAFRRILHRNNANNIIGYHDARGNEWLRDEFSKYLNETRGLQITKDQIMITRGETGVFLTSIALIKPGDNVIVGDSNNYIVDRIYQKLGANTIKVTVDQYGIDVSCIESICKKQKIRLVYVTPLFHYPTTVTLSESRRMRLLQLAEAYSFAIIENDDEFELQFTQRPILPLAANDRKGMVVLLGSLTKSIVPAFRIGFIAAPTNLITELAKYRRMVDYQGDAILEQAIAQLFWEGEIARTIKRVKKVYRERRDYFCSMLETGLADYVSFKKPNGGLAVWAHFNSNYPVQKTIEKALSFGLLVSGTEQYQQEGKHRHAIRLGYGSLNFDEIDEALGILKKAMV